jgi:hypothetical protein
MTRTPSPQREPIRIPATVIKQRDVTIYSFALTAELLMLLGRVERFGEDSNGVNRKYDENHAIKIAFAMTQDDTTVLLDAICGDLAGRWEFEDGILTAYADAYISIDDGQHRLAALSLLNAEERERWEFQVMTTQGLDYKTRLRIFRQQMKRKRIDSRLDLAQRHRLDDWRSDAERQAYLLLLQLNSASDSPLKDLIILEETVRRPYGDRYRPEGINANGLWGTLKSVMSKGSPLFALPLEKRAEVALNMIRLASEIWPNAWRSPDHVLTTARGINAILKLMVSSPEFRGVIGDDFRVESLRRGLTYAGRFSWTVGRWRNASTDEIVHRLNDSIARARQRDAAGGDVTA